MRDQARGGRGETVAVCTETGIEKWEPLIMKQDLLRGEDKPPLRKKGKWNSPASRGLVIGILHLELLLSNPITQISYFCAESIKK